MRPILAQLEQEISELDTNEKLYLLEKLVREAHNIVAPQTEELWYKEAKAREEAVISGKLETVSWERVKTEARKLF